MLVERASAASCYHKGRVYAVGGYCPETGKVLDYCEEFDIATGVWREAGWNLQKRRIFGKL